VAKFPAVNSVDIVDNFCLPADEERQATSFTRAPRRGRPRPQAGQNANRRAIKQPLLLHARRGAPACEARRDEQERRRARVSVRTSSINP